MDMPLLESVKDAFNNDSAVKAQQARTLADLCEVLRPQLDEAGQLVAAKLQASDISWLPRPGERGSR